MYISILVSNYKYGMEQMPDYSTDYQLKPGQSHLGE